MKKNLLGAALGVSLLAALAYFWINRSDHGSTPPAPATVGGDAGRDSVAAQSEAQSGLQPGDAQERHLVGVVLREDEAQSQAHIMRRGVTGVYRLQDEVPPDQAVLTAVRIDHVLLQPPDSEQIMLKLENLSDEERFLYSPEVNLDDVEDVVGNRYEAETPEGKALLEKYPDPHAPCGEIKDDAEQEKCEDRIDAEMEAAADKCEQIDDADEYDQCLETAYRFTAEAAARARAGQP